MPGGILRLSVPDLDRCVAAYDSANPDEFCSAVFEAKHVREKNQHHWMYNETSMGKLLEDVGFRKVYRCKYREGKSPDVEKIDNRPESLFMEAVK
jgi:predicted SAM-dependent methyltransferase